jgi:hypothetical protein
MKERHLLDQKSILATSLAAFFAKKLTFTPHDPDGNQVDGVNGLTVLLEKIAGSALVNKLRAILLFKVDSNKFNWFIFVDRTMTLARQHHLIPDEQYAEQESEASDGAWSKHLFADVSRQGHLLMGIVSADAESCYDML